MRDAFYEFISSVMKKYTKYLLTPKSINSGDMIEAKSFFDFDGFMKSKDGGTKPDNFIYQFCQTS